MTQDRIDKIMLVGKFMKVKNLFVLHYKKDKEPMGVYIGDEDGMIDYVDIGIDFYSPDTDWNTLIEVGKKCQVFACEQPDRPSNNHCSKLDFVESEIGMALRDYDKKKMFEKAVEFIELYNIKNK